MKIAGIYARESKSNGQGETLDHQIKIIKEFASRMKDDIVFDDKFIYVDRQSGFKTTMLQRDAMKQLLEDIDMIDVVFFKGISRFARDSSESISTAKRLIQKGIRVISIEENYDSETSDETIFQIHSVFAEHEARKISIRVALGSKQKAQDGQWTTSQPPFGYSRVKDIKDKDLRDRHPQSLYPNKDAEIVRTVFDLYVNHHYGSVKIVNYLADRGIKTANGNPFYTVSIIRMLENEAYIGKIVYGKTRHELIDEEDGSRKIAKEIKLEEKDWIVCDNAHPPIIDVETFNKAQQLLRVKGAKNKGRQMNNAKHPLTGIIRCGCCGGTMVCQKRTVKLATGEEKSYRYYVCNLYLRRGRGSCSQRNIKADELEERIYNAIVQQIKKCDFDSGDFVRHSPVNDIKARIKTIEKQIDKNIKESKFLLENREIYDIDTFKSINNEYKEQIVKLRRQKEELLQELKFGDVMLSEEDLIQKYKEFLELDLSDYETMKIRFHEWINEVTVKGKEIQIDQKFKPVK